MAAAKPRTCTLPEGDGPASDCQSQSGIAITLTASDVLARSRVANPRPGHARAEIDYLDPEKVMPQATVAKTLGDLVDRAALVDLVSSYAILMDRREWGLYRAIFADELNISFPDWTSGPTSTVSADEWVYIVRRTLTGYRSTHHLLANHLVELSADTAIVHSHMTARHVFSDDEEEFLGGYYAHHAVRQDGRWKLCGVHLTSTWDKGPRELFQRAWDRGEIVEAG